MRQSVVRAVFAVVVLALPVQVAVREVASEPYPGLYQPSFGGDVPSGDVYQTYEPLVTVAERGGARRDVDYRALLPETPVLPFAVFQSAFADQGRASDPRAERWLRERLVALDPETDPETVTIRWVHVDRRAGSPDSKVADVVKTLVVDVGQEG